MYPISITAEDIETIVTLHNEFRRKVANGEEMRGDPGPQPSASNMREIVPSWFIEKIQNPLIRYLFFQIWDEELATLAQVHAQQCVFEHDTCRDVRRF